MPPTFARAQIESILLDAARLDDARGAESPGVALARMGNDDLTLAEVERAAAEVGISRAAVSIAALRLALRDAHAASPRAHGEQEIAGELSGEARERLADAIRTRVSPISVWSAAPVLSGGDIASGAALGVPAFLFPIVAASSGQWPALAAAVALGGAGALAGTGVAIAVKRRLFERWRARVEEAVTAIATSASGLVGER